MPVQSTESGVLRFGNGVTTEFSFTFAVHSADTIGIARIDGLLSEVVDSGEYTVLVNSEGTAGSVTFFVAPPDGEVLYISRTTAITQLIEVTSQNKYDPVVVQQVWDKLTLIAQELRRDVARAVISPPNVDPENLYNILQENVESSEDAAALAQAAALAVVESEAYVRGVEDSLPSWQGAWVTATAYMTGDLVRQAGSSYICLIAHTSGVFSTDLIASRWDVFAQQGATGSGMGDVLAANNGSDFADPASVRANIGLGSAAIADAIAFVAAEMLVGQIAYFAMNTPPLGTLKANGAAVSRTTYARLFAKIGTTHGAGDGVTTFNLPDRRGVFQRGWDDGRGIDAGRVFGSEQLDAFKSHSHSGTAASAGAHTHNLAIIGYGDNGGSYPSLGGNKEGATNLTTSSAGEHSHSLTIDAAGEAETRPRNVADLAVIFY